MKDFRGTEIVVGSKIVYAVKHSTYVKLTEATVQTIGERPTWGSPQPIIKVQRAAGGKSVTLTSTQTIVVLS